MSLLVSGAVRAVTGAVVREARVPGPEPQPFGLGQEPGGSYYTMRARTAEGVPRRVSVYVVNNRIKQGPQHIVGARWSDLQAAIGYRPDAQIEGPFEQPPPGAFEHSLWTQNPAPTPLGAVTADEGLTRALDTATPFPQFGAQRGYLEKLRSPAPPDPGGEPTLDEQGRRRLDVPPHLRSVERAEGDFRDAMRDAYFDPGGLSSYDPEQRARVDELDAGRRQAHALAALHPRTGYTASPSLHSGSNGHAPFPKGDGHDGNGPPAPPAAGGQGAVPPPGPRAGPSPAPPVTPPAPSTPVEGGSIDLYKRPAGPPPPRPSSSEEPPPAPVGQRPAPALAPETEPGPRGPLARLPRRPSI